MHNFDKAENELNCNKLNFNAFCYKIISIKLIVVQMLAPNFLNLLFITNTSNEISDSKFLTRKINSMNTENKISEMAETGVIESGKFKLRYLIEGEGPPAIVIGSWNYYPRTFSSNLRRHLRLIFMDHRGFAPSPGPVDNAEFELDILLDDIELLRKKLKLEKVIIIGHSGHAIMALEYAKKYSQHVSHVVMIGISPGLSEENADATEKNWQNVASVERKAALAKSFEIYSDKKLTNLSSSERFTLEYVRKGPQIWYDFNFNALPLWENVVMNVDMFNHVWGSIFKTIDITKNLDKLQKPIFLALGQYDFIVTPSTAWENIIANYNNFTMCIFEKSGHTPQYEEPELFDTELLQWLSKNE